MESQHSGVATLPSTGIDGISLDEVSEPGSEPGIEQYITSQMVLSLLGIPETGLLRISAALLIAGNNELCAYWWRDPYTGRQHAELRDPVLVRSAFSNVVVDSGYLPPNVVRLGITNGVQWLVVSVPPSFYQLTLLDDVQHSSTLRVRLPGLVLTGCDTHYWLWAVKDAIVSANTLLYHVPLPNIGADGTLCFGNNHVPKAAGPTILQALHLFLDSPFTTHWATGKSLAHPGDIRRCLFDSVEQEAGVFPEDDLKPITTGDARSLTLDVLLRHVLRR